MHKLRIPLPLVTLLAICAFLAVGTGTAKAASKGTGTTPCWRLVLNDEYDGHIDNTYPVHCYRDAIDNLPGDSLIYGRFKGDLDQAMTAAIADLRAKGIRVGPNTKLRAETPSRRLEGQHKRRKGIFAAIADKIGPGNASSIPVPLLVLGGLGILLVVAAGASFAARWIAARRAQPSPATSPATPPHE